MRHRAMWASGDYPSMVETFRRRSAPGSSMRAGSSRAARARHRGGHRQCRDPRRTDGRAVTACDLTPELFDAGRARAEEAGVEIEWVEADAEDLPFEDATFDVVMAAIGVMFAPPTTSSPASSPASAAPAGRSGF